MRRTAFLLGPGLCLCVTFWNSVTWFSELSHCERLEGSLRKHSGRRKPFQHRCPGVNRGLPLPPIQVVGRAPPLRAAHLHWVLLELTVFTLTEEVMFYYMHWLVHHPIFYKKIPKKHHEWTAPIGTISLHVLPLERSVQPV
ncbi:Fatty acid hydroxylase domain-containing protein 2 [Manis javanica]|nr:Fatty acid hydroxylase domain-containing protein 2 [Manis javanica]